MRNAAHKEGGEGRAVAQLTKNFKKFYENISLEELLERGIARGFHPTVLELTLSGYAFERRIVCEELVSGPAYARHGVVAGCPFATTMVKVFYLLELDELYGKWQREAARGGFEVDLAAYIDDIGATVRGTERQVVEVTPELEKDIDEMMIDKVQGEIAHDKNNLTASSLGVWRKINGRRAQQAQNEPQEDSFLGIELMTKGHRGAFKKSSRFKKRWAAAKRRKERLARLKTKQLKSRKVFSGALQASAAYGACVWGISNSELLALRRIAASVFPCGRGRSLSVAMGVYGDATWRPAVAPALKWASEVFNAKRASAETPLRCRSSSASMNPPERGGKEGKRRPHGGM